MAKTKTSNLSPLVASVLRITQRKAQKLLDHKTYPTYAERYVMALQTLNWASYGPIKKYTYVIGKPIIVQGVRVTVDHNVAVMEAQGDSPRVFRGKSCASLIEKALRAHFIERIVLERNTECSL